jgi:transcriptional regulator with XRE-family HTH domain
MPQPLSNEHKELLTALGGKVKSIRQEKGLTLEQVANKIGKDRQSIHKLEKGLFNPSYIYILEVCRGLGIKVGDLIGEQGQQANIQ